MVNSIYRNSNQLTKVLNILDMFSVNDRILIFHIRNCNTIKGLFWVYEPKKHIENKRYVLNPKCPLENLFRT